MQSGTLSSRGQITIPVEIRERLGLHEVDRVEFIAQGEDIIVRAARRNRFTQKDAEVRFGLYSTRRKASNASGPRRLLADFIIGSRAPHHRADRLLKFNQVDFANDFPELTMIPRRYAKNAD